MASPQLEKGYTQIANELLEALAKINLSPYETRVLLVILRKTYGFHKKSDAISLSQIDALSKIGRVAASKALKKLEGKHVLLVDRKQRTPIIQFNKNFDEWGRSKPVYCYRDTRPWYRARGNCEFCKTEPYKHKHHIVPKTEGGKDASENYAHVCEECHTRIHEFMERKGITGQEQCQKFYSLLIKLLSSDLTTSIWTNLSSIETTPMSSKQTTEVSSKQTTTKERKIGKENITKETRGDGSFDPLGAEIIKAFEVVDAKNKQYYGNTTQRSACDFLLAEYGLSICLERIALLPQTNTIQYFPTITTPVQLRDKWVQLESAVRRKSAELSKPKRTVIL